MKIKYFFHAAIIFILTAEAYILQRFEIIPLALKWLSKGSDCPFAQTMAVTANNKRLEEAAHRIRDASRLLLANGNLQLWSTPYGNIWLPASSAFNGLVGLEDVETGLYTFGRDRVHSGDVVLDCGAYIGAFTRSALKMGASLVIAIEPSPESASCLQKTFAKEISVGRVKVCQVGVWHKDDTLTLHGEGGAASVVVNSGPSSRYVRMTSIDNLVAALDLSRVDFIKMDIEGAETQAIEGARKTIMRWKPRLVVSPEHAQDEAQKVVAAVRSIVPDYEIKCGQCIFMYDRIIPEAILFRMPGGDLRE